MKRERDLYQKLISDDNLRRALFEVSATHRWRPHHKPNKAVAWVESDIEQRIKDLREIIDKGFEPSPAALKRRWDKSACKWRDIHEPKLWPDQYVHHALVQVLEPVMMRGMDHWCAGSIKGRGIHYGLNALKKWNKNDFKGTRWCAELDIYHFYNSLTSTTVVNRFRCLIKDYRVLDLIERVTRDGIMIGAYCSQWFANTVLQPLDHLLRESGIKIKHYLRYMDNFTLYSSSKRELIKAIKLINEWLHGHCLRLKDNWQYFRTEDRLPSALGYRYGHGYTLLRKRNLQRLKRQLLDYYSKVRRGVKVPRLMATGLISRLGQLRHCNSVRLYKKLVKPGTQKALKSIIREYSRKESLKWNTYTEQLCVTA